MHIFHPEIVKMAENFKTTLVLAFYQALPKHIRALGSPSYYYGFACDTINDTVTQDLRDRKTLWIAKGLCKNDNPVCVRQKARKSWKEQYPDAWPRPLLETNEDPCIHDLFESNKVISTVSMIEILRHSLNVMW